MRPASPRPRRASPRILAIPAARIGAAVAAGVFAVSVLAGAVRVLPLLLAPGVPLGLAPALGRGVLGVSLETALFVAPPIAWALAAARLVDRGEARALFAIGVRPLEIIAGTWPAAIGIALAAAIAAASWGREAAAPGRLVRDLLAEARDACQSAPPPAAASVPVLEISWVCLPGEPARVVGAAPLGAFSAREVVVSEDLRAIDAADFSLVVPTGGSGSARLHAAEASIHGLVPVGRASNLSVPRRAFLIAATTLAMATLAAGLVLVRAIRSRAISLAVGAAGPAAALMAFSSLERGPTPTVAYLSVPLAGAASMAAVSWLAARRKRRA